MRFYNHFPFLNIVKFQTAVLRGDRRQTPPPALCPPYLATHLLLYSAVTSFLPAPMLKIILWTNERNVLVLDS